jgi:heterodisulfide reductase subunit A
MCESLCSYKAIEVRTVDEKRGIEAAVVTEAMCKGCGGCVANCRSSALNLRGFTNDQIFSAISSF